MRAVVKLDKLALSAKGKGQIYYPYQDSLPNYNFNGFFNPNKDKVEDKTVLKYENVVKFQHVENDNRLIVCNNISKETPQASPLYVIFYTNYDHVISYRHVYQVAQYFQQFRVRLCVSQIDLAIDLISDQRMGLYHTVIRSIKPGFKRKPSKVEETGMYFGESVSSNVLVVYDKLVQLANEKAVHLPGDRCRIEIRLKPHKLFNFVQTIDDLAVQDWSFIYPKYLSLHQLKPELKNGMESIGIDWSRPIWELRDIMEEDFNVWPSNFYRDYLMDHPLFSYLVRDALFDYRWCRNYKQFQS
jgi:hypothetical protein